MAVFPEPWARRSSSLEAWSAHTTRWAPADAKSRQPDHRRNAKPGCWVGRDLSVCDEARRRPTVVGVRLDVVSCVPSWTCVTGGLCHSACVRLDGSVKPEAIVTGRNNDGWARGDRPPSNQLHRCAARREGKQRPPARGGRGGKKTGSGHLNWRRGARALPTPPNAATRSIPSLPTPWKAVRRSISKSRSGPRHWRCRQMPSQPVETWARE